MSQPESIAPEEHLALLYRTTHTVDLVAFVANYAPLSSEAFARVLSVDLECRYRVSQPLSVEHYLQQFPQIAANTTTVSTLVATEFVERTKLGEELRIDEFFRRFPSHAHSIRNRIANLNFQSMTHNLQVRDSPLQDPIPKTSRLNSVEQRTPRQVGRYRLERVLGKGGMGAVYLAIDTVLDRPVALKLPHVVSPLDHEITDHFYREARAAAKLRHPNIGTVFDVGEIEGQLFISMEYIDGTVLSDYLARQPRLSERQVVELLLPIIRAMATATSWSVISKWHGHAKHVIKSIGISMAPDPDWLVALQNHVIGEHRCERWFYRS